MFQVQDQADDQQPSGCDVEERAPGNSGRLSRLRDEGLPDREGIDTYPEALAGCLVSEFEPHSFYAPGTPYWWGGGEKG